MSPVLYLSRDIFTKSQEARSHAGERRVPVSEKAKGSSLKSILSQVSGDAHGQMFCILRGVWVWAGCT